MTPSAVHTKHLTLLQQEHTFALQIIYIHGVCVLSDIEGELDSHKERNTLKFHNYKYIT